MHTSFRHTMPFQVSVRFADARQQRGGGSTPEKPWHSKCASWPVKQKPPEQYGRKSVWSPFPSTRRQEFGGALADTRMDSQSTTTAVHSLDSQRFHFLDAPLDTAIRSRWRIQRYCFLSPAFLPPVSSLETGDGRYVSLQQSEIGRTLSS